MLNVTPDSFSDGGQYLQMDAALRRAEVMVAQGAGLVDVGGESTRPGAAPVSVQEELDRVLPVVERLARELPVPISVDTSKPELMRELARAGAGLINDASTADAWSAGGGSGQWPAGLSDAPAEVNPSPCNEGLFTLMWSPRSAII